MWTNQSHNSGRREKVSRHGSGAGLETSGALEGQLEVVAYAETGAFRWQTSFVNTGRAPIREVTRLNALDLDLRPDIGRLVVHCVRRDGDYIQRYRFRHF